MLRVTNIKIIIAVICGLLVSQARSQNADYTLLRSLNAGEMPNWDIGMRGLSESVVPVAIASPLCISLHGALSHKKTVKINGLNSAVTVVFAMGISTIVKYSVQRTRPYDQYPGDIIQRDAPSTFSFPSGHTTAAFSTATAISLTYRKWYVTVPAYMYAGFVGYSRMRLGVHYPTDVLAGAILGTGSGFLVWFVQKKIEERIKKKHEARAAATS